MKSIILFSTLVTVTLAGILPEQVPSVIPILRQESEVGIDGRYSSSFETGNGIKSEEQGTLKNAGTQNEAQEVVGKVEYQSPEGFPIFLEYLANELGFQAKGDHLPVAPVDTNTPPPIPPAILRALEYNAAHPEEDDSVQHQAQGQFSP